MLPQLNGDPPHPQEGEIWFDLNTSRMKFFHNGVIRSIRFGAEKLLAPDIKLSEYIDLVMGMLLTFGLSFQLPLVVMAVAKIGIVEVQTLKNWRRYVYFALTIVACAITPGDVITASLALTIPLALLYELGIWLAQFKPKPSPS
jgi:Sec-independent protein secretion pathway component TatC